MIRLLATLLLTACVARAQSMQGIASWYGEESRGRPMADRGRPFNPNAFTCASWFYSFGTVLAVRHGGRTVYVVVTDRGPDWQLVRTRGVILDLSRYSFSKLAPLDLGLIPVTITVAQRGGTR
jgi:rare lipoprotein A (peptidoglycan hydrolase)